MTISVCLTCGDFKHGAIGECPHCKESCCNTELSLLLTDHYLEKSELKQIGKAIAVLNKTGLDRDTKTNVLLYYLSRKWPKIIDFHIEELPRDVVEVVDGVYRSHLKKLPGQQDDKLKTPPILKDRWCKAVNEEMQADEDDWKNGLPELLRYGLNIAKEIVKLKIAVGEGAVFQRIKYIIKSVFSPIDYGAHILTVDSLVKDAHEYERFVQRYRKPVKNGWSEQTKRRAEYLGGTYSRLVEMSMLCQKIVYCKARKIAVIPIDFQRIKQEFAVSYEAYVELYYVVARPEKIQIGGEE